jgi:hypothetical protein
MLLKSRGQVGVARVQNFLANFQIYVDEIQPSVDEI